MQIDKQYKEQLEDFKATKGYQYALDVVNEEIPADKYIVIMCQNFLRDVQSIENDDFDYFLDLNYFTRVTKLLKLMKMGSGLSQGKTVYNSLAGFQWLFIINALVWRIKKDPEKRRYEKSVLLIGRKSGKQYN